MDALKIAALALAIASGCAPLAAYERETLATSRMSLDPDRDEASLEQTRLRTREEGHVGAGGVGGGGGCGCN